MASLIRSAAKIDGSPVQKARHDTRAARAGAVRTRGADEPVGPARMGLRGRPTEAKTPVMGITVHNKEVKVVVQGSASGVMVAADAQAAGADGQGVGVGGLITSPSVVKNPPAGRLVPSVIAHLSAASVIRTSAVLAAFAPLAPPQTPVLSARALVLAAAIRPRAIGVLTGRRRWPRRRGYVTCPLLRSRP